MILIINTCQKNTLLLGLADAKKVLVCKKYHLKFHESEKLIGCMAKLLRGQKIEWKDLTGIIIARGPAASFTSLRIGITVANVLSWSLNIPIAGREETGETTCIDLWEKGYKKLKKGKLLKPFYGREPNITIAKA